MMYKLMLLLIAVSLYNKVVDANCPDDPPAAASHHIFYRNNSVNDAIGIIDLIVVDLSQFTFL